MLISGKILDTIGALHDSLTKTKKELQRQFSPHLIY